MKRYLINVTLFLAMIAAVLVVMEAVVRHYPNSYRFKHEWMEENASSVKTLILGGSHTYYAIIPEMLGDSVFSLANVTQHPEYDYWLLEQYIDRCTNLKTVILPVDGSNLFDPKLEESEEWHRCTYYHIYMGYPKHDYNPKYSFEVSNLAAFNLKLRPALSYLFTGEARIDCDSTGFGSNFTTPEEFDSVYMERDARITFNRLKNSSTVDYNVHYMDRIARLCQDRGIGLLLITTPMWEGYVKKYGQSHYDKIHQIAARYVNQCGAQYHDYMKDPRFQGVDFHDASHLSRQGAEKFTMIFKKDFGIN